VGVGGGGSVVVCIILIVMDEGGRSWTKIWRLGYFFEMEVGITIARGLEAAWWERFALRYHARLLSGGAF
jgi:hypothetical protein